jgi:hypothetical protein
VPNSLLKGRADDCHPLHPENVELPYFTVIQSYSLSFKRGVHPSRNPEFGEFIARRRTLRTFNLSQTVATLLPGNSLVESHTISRDSLTGVQAAPVFSDIPPWSSILSYRTSFHSQNYSARLALWLRMDAHHVH